MMLPTFCVYYTGTILRFSDFNVFPLNPFNSFFYHSEVTNLFWQKNWEWWKGNNFHFRIDFNRWEGKNVLSSGGLKQIQAAAAAADQNGFNFKRHLGTFEQSKTINIVAAFKF